jgi:hypothetical protein
MCYKQFLNNPKISDKDGIPISKFSSYFPYDSLGYKEYYVTIDKLHDRILTKFSKNDSLALYNYKKKSNENNLIDTILPVYYGQKDNIDKYLKSLNENILYNFFLSKDKYRLTVLRTFNNPFTLIIEKSQKNQIIIYLKVTDGKGGYYPGKLVVYKKHVVADLIWNNFIKLLDKNHYDSLPENLTTKEGTDGSIWYFESHTKNGYKQIHCWSPNKNSIFMQVFELLSRNLEYKFDDIY